MSRWRPRAQPPGPPATHADQPALHPVTSFERRRPATYGHPHSHIGIVGTRLDRLPGWEGHRRAATLLSCPNSRSPPRPLPPSDGPRVAAIVAGASIALLAFVLLLAAAAPALGRLPQGRRGFLTTSTERFHTSAYALATDDLDIDGHGSDWLVPSDRFGKMRLRAHLRPTASPSSWASPRSDRRPRTTSRLPAYASVADVDVSTHSTPTYHRPRRQRAAPASPERPELLGRVRPTAHGRQSLTWDVRHGAWSVVVMNDDGSRGVDAARQRRRVRADPLDDRCSALGIGTLLAPAVAACSSSASDRRAQPAGSDPVRVISMRRACGTARRPPGRRGAASSVAEERLDGDLVRGRARRRRVMRAGSGVSVAVAARAHRGRAWPRPGTC